MFRQTNRIADALTKGDIALAQIYGLYIPLSDLSDRQLANLSADARLTKSGYSPDEPRIPKGSPHGGEWTSGNTETIGDTGTAGDGPNADVSATGPLAIDAMTVSSDDTGSSGVDASAGPNPDTTSPGNAATGSGPTGSSTGSPPIKWEMKPLPNPPPPPSSRRFGRSIVTECE